MTPQGPIQAPAHDKALTVLDLFAGAGGMALGFQAAGARCVGAVELDPVAGATFARFFEPDKPLVLSGPEQGDMVQLNPKSILDRLPNSPDIVVGGPPCQGFSRIGRAKNKSLLEQPEQVRFGGVRDPDRNQLYRRFLAVVAAARPLAFVMENVPGIRELQGIDMAGRIAREAAHLGYNVRYFLLNAAWYGVPQQRWRVFFVGLRFDLGHDAMPHPPPRTHTFGPQIPEGITIPDDPCMLWGEQIPSIANPSRALTTRDALDDLPRLDGHLKGERPSGEALPYRRDCSPSIRILRDWPGRAAPAHVGGNWYRSTPRDYPIFAEMAHGDRYPQALSIAHRRFLRAVADQRKNGTALTGAKLASFRATFIPPYRNDAFDEKWGKLDPNAPAWTVTAHLSRDTYSHIHYDSSQARTITVREAARLQSFPDCMSFEGNYGEQFRQIGNAVPPLLAKALAQQLVSQLLSIRRKRLLAARNSA